jgi:hypothetical protein
MPCGCKGSPGPLPQSLTASSLAGTAPVTKRIAVYQVKKDGDTMLSTTSPIAARSEAKRIGGSVHVTSRPVDAEPQELAG